MGIAGGLAFFSTYLAMDAGFRAGEIAAAKQSEAGVAVAGSLGSTVFDILFALGFPWLVRCIISGQDVDYTTSSSQLRIDILFVLILMVFLCGLLFAYAFQLTRRLGILLITAYAVFVAYCLATGVQDTSVATV